MKLNIGAFALAFGFRWGGGIFVATWWLIARGGEATAPMLLDHFYHGYSVTPLGSLIGLPSRSARHRSSATRASLWCLLTTHPLPFLFRISAAEAPE
jgi:hypothetical protein